MGIKALRRCIILLIILFLSLSSSTLSHGEAQLNASVKLTVYSDGFVLVEAQYKVVEPPENGIVSLHLLTSAFDNLIVSSSSGPVAYYISGDALLVEVNEETRDFLVLYETQELTRKEGRYWELVINLTSQAEILLPEGSLVIYLNKQPNSITASGNRPVLTLDKGEWVIGYVLENNHPVGAGDEGNNPQLRIMFGDYMLLVFPVIGVAAGLSLMVIYKRIVVARSRKLSEDELRVLSLVKSKGRISEAEIRSELRLPKTTVWRVVRRLERKRLVKVRKIGNRNEVEPA